MLEVLPNLGRMQERLGRNTTNVQTSASQFGILLNDCCFQSVLTGADGGGIPARAASDHN